MKRIALEHVGVLEKKMRELQEMVATLRHLADNCRGNDRPNCPIIHGLACSDCEDRGPSKGRRHLGKGFEVLR